MAGHLQNRRNRGDAHDFMRFGFRYSCFEFYGLFAVYLNWGLFAFLYGFKPTLKGSNTDTQDLSGVGPIAIGPVKHLQNVALLHFP